MMRDRRIPIAVCHGRRCAAGTGRVHPVVRNWLRAAILCIALLPVPGVPGARAQGQDAGRKLEEMSIEELMNLEVTSVAKRQQTVRETASAIFVITAEDIRHSGATSLPDVLRMVPGMDVARINANTWAVSARGFNSRFANKMLVLIDGRSVYDPLFSGVFWDVQDVLLEDVERIEVIRGPGASVWGANAVNGVINIITRSAKDTQGGLITAGGGNADLGVGSFRYGAQSGRSAWTRLFAKYGNHASGVSADGHSGVDSWDNLHFGFRTDWEVSHSDSLTLQGDLYRGTSGETETMPQFTPPYAQTVADRTQLNGANLLARWNHNFSSRSRLKLQAYYDRTDRTDMTLDEIRNTFDVDLQHELDLGRRHELVWGFGFRSTADSITPNEIAFFTPRTRLDNLWSGFVQDEVAVVPHRLRLILGSKFEHNDYTGFEVQPTARLWVSPSPHHSLWIAASRAVRTPSRFESDVRAHMSVSSGPGGVPLAIAYIGDRAFHSEALMAYEVGWRMQAGEKISFDLAAFSNHYTGLLSVRQGALSFEPDETPPHFVLPFQIANAMHGNTHGVELAANWNPRAHWNLRAAGSWLAMNLHAEQGSPDSYAASQRDQDPDYQARISSQLDIRSRWEWDFSFGYVSRLQSLGIPGHFRLDSRVGFRASDSLNLSLVVQDLLAAHQLEFAFPYQIVGSTESRRAVFGKVTWTF